MTDTSRTKAELLDIFQDGQNGTITAQDMRDFVVSPAFYDSNTAYINFNDKLLVNGGAGYGAEVIWDDFSPAQYGVDYFDPDFSLAGSDPNSAQGLDVNGAFMMPHGHWGFQVNYSFSTDISSNPKPPAFVTFDQARYDPGFAGAHDGTEPFIYDYWVNPIQWLEPGTIIKADGSVNFYAQAGSVMNDKTDPQPFTVFGYTTFGQTADVTVTATTVLIWRIA